MSSFVYTAKIAPIGKDISMPGEKVRPLVLDETTWQAWCEEPWHVGVWTNHERSSKVGQCMYIRVRDGWYAAEFFLSDAIERHLPEGLPVGQPMSVGFRTFRGSIHLLQEISIVPKAAIRGAEIISRRERKATAPSSSVSAPKPKPNRVPTPGNARAAAPPRIAAPPLVRGSWRDEKDESEMAEFRRRLDAAGPNADFELILENLKIELGYSSGLERYYRSRLVAA